MLKRLILAIIFLAVVVGGLVGFNMFRSKAIKDFFANMPPKVNSVSTITVEPTVWSPGIEAIGTANAIEGVDLTFKVAGIVNQINFTANEKVKQGDILIQLDDNIQKADLESAKAEAVLAEQNLDRARTLRDQRVGSVQNVDTTSAQAASAQARVAKLQATLDQQILSAPFSGVMGIPKVDIGQYVSPGTMVATIQNVDTMRVDFTVPEQVLGQLQIGQPIHVGPNSTDLNFSGKIVGIDPKINPTTRMVSVRAEVANPDNVLTPGQFVQIRVELPQENDVVVLPQTAIINSLYGDYVFVVSPLEKDGAVAKDAKGNDQLIVDQVFVQTGRRAKDMIEITKGVSGGDVVVTAGQNRLSAKSHVAIDNTINPASSAKN